MSFRPTTPGSRHHHIQRSSPGSNSPKKTSAPSDEKSGEDVGLRKSQHDVGHPDATTEVEPGSRLSELVAAEKAAKEKRFQRQMAEARARKLKVLARHMTQ